MKKRVIYALMTVMVLLTVLIASAAPVAFADNVDAGELPETGFVNDENSEGVNEAAQPLYTDLTDFKSVAKSKGMELYMREYKGVGVVLAVKDLKTGVVQYSVSSKASQLDDNEQIRAASLGTVSYMDSTGTMQRVYTGDAYIAGNYKFENIKNGIRITYEFKDMKKGQGFSVPFVFTVADDHFEAGVEIKNIKVDKKCTGLVMSVAVLPYFASADYGTEGYMLIPDGSGTLIENDYASRDGTVKYYETYVYGYDTTIARTNTSITLNNTEATTLPVFGVKSDSTAMFAVIDSGDAISQVKAVSSREAFPFTSTYAEFIVNKSDTYSSGKSSHRQRSSRRSTHRYANTELAKVQYYSLQGEDSDYVGMAECYRDYLIGKGAGAEINENLNFYMDVIGAINKTESVYGFITDVTKPITTFADAEKMVKELSDADVKNINVRLKGWHKGGLESTAMTDAKVEAKLGGKDDLLNLNKTITSLGGKLTADFELINIYDQKSGWSFSKIAVRDLVSSVAQQPIFKPNIGTFDEKNVFYRCSGSYISKQIDSFIGDYKELGLSGISVGSLGNNNYSDFYIGERFNDAQNTRDYILDAVAGLKKNVGKVTVDGGNGYTLPYVDTVIAPPMYDSGYEMSMAEIPFLQIALHGLINYTESAHNLNSSPTLQMLRQLETGSAPYYIFTEAENSVFLNTNFNYIYSSQFNTWKNSAVSNYKTLSSVLNGYCDDYITDHEIITDKVRATTYGDDLVVLVNYSSEEYDCYGIKVPAEGYATSTAKAFADAKASANSQPEGEVAE